MKNLGRIYRTIRYLKFVQIYYRIFYLFRGVLYHLVRKKIPYNLEVQGNFSLKLQDAIPSRKCAAGNTFIFLNQTFTFEDINWDENKFGLLWGFNLNYFDFLIQPGMDKSEGLRLIKDFINRYPENKICKYPYTISLRGINWIKFLTKYNIADQAVISHLFGQYKLLYCSFEYNLMGNHLLENAFSMLFAAYYFNNAAFYKKAEKVLKRELDEQILSDGAHFERSVMYHLIMLQRVLDCINLIKNNHIFQEHNLGEYLGKKAVLMLSYAKAMELNNGDYSHMNDSSDGIAPQLIEVKSYAQTLGFEVKERSILQESGYRVFRSNNFELVCDVGDIGPNYQPAHAHSDTFNFELYISGDPLIVDTGVSTYENNSIRKFERSTRAHNTVEINNTDQSEVWHGFRVGRRAFVRILHESDNAIRAVHSGYKHLNALHVREFNIIIGGVVINDFIESGDSLVCRSYLHFAPNISFKVSGNMIIGSFFEIELKGIKGIEIGDYEFAAGFNIRKNAKFICSMFDNSMKTIIRYK